MNRDSQEQRKNASIDDIKIELGRVQRYRSMQRMEIKTSETLTKLKEPSLVVTIFDYCRENYCLCKTLCFDCTTNFVQGDDDVPDVSVQPDREQEYTTELTQHQQQSQVVDTSVTHALYTQRDNRYLLADHGQIDPILYRLGPFESESYFFKLQTTFCMNSIQAVYTLDTQTHLFGVDVQQCCEDGCTEGSHHAHHVKAQLGRRGYEHT